MILYMNGLSNMLDLIATTVYNEKTREDFPIFIDDKGNIVLAYIESTLLIAKRDWSVSAYGFVSISKSDLNLKSLFKIKEVSWSKLELISVFQSPRSDWVINQSLFPVRNLRIDSFGYRIVRFAVMCIDGLVKDKYNGAKPL